MASGLIRNVYHNFLISTFLTLILSQIAMDFLNSTLQCFYPKHFTISATCLSEVMFIRVNSAIFPGFCRILQFSPAVSRLNIFPSISRIFNFSKRKKPCGDDGNSFTQTAPANKTRRRAVEEEQQLEDSRMGGHERDRVPAKKAKRLCKNLTKWEETYPYLMKGNVGPSNP